ncbi:hypothetical protein EDD86DRAFT_250204 [Gorgonomyces haynaldii]|nr:hypothetical protein EDD86DRAFT_250204 [Gorgonomyces haynaldii]
MYAFNLTDASSSRPDGDQVWPVSYQEQAKYLPYSKKCQNVLQVPLSQECCISNLLSTSWQSSLTAPVPNGDTLLAVPRRADGNLFCALKPNNGSLFGFRSIFYLSNNECNPRDLISCNQDGTLSVYPNSCLDQPRVYALPQTINDEKLGNVNVEYFSITGRVEFSWTAYVPTDRYTPTFRYSSEWLMLIVFVVALVLNLLSTFKHIKQTNRLKYWFSICSLLLWLVYMILCLLKQFRLSSSLLVNVIGSCASLTSVIKSTQQSMILMHLTLFLQLLVLSSVVLTHIGLRYILVPIEANGIVWTLFYLIYDTLGPIYYCWRLVRILKTPKSGPFSTFLKNYGSDKHFYHALLLQMSLLFVYLSVWNEGLEHDRVSVNDQTILESIESIHASVNLFLLDRMIEKRQDTQATIH